MSISNVRRVYALGAYTVEVRPRGLFYKNTYAEDDWHGPYASPASVSLMIARQLRRELERRDAPHQLPN